MTTAADTSLGYRSEVVGSLLRPEYLKEAFEQFEQGEIAEDDLVAAQDRAALEAIKLQEECGLDVLTDGEVRRRFWFDPLTASLGYNYQESAPVPFTAGGQRPEEAPPKLPVVTEPLRVVQNLPLREYSFVHQHAHTPTKTTIAGMTYASVLWVPGVSDGSYADRDQYMADVLRLMKEVVRQVVEAGTNYVQLDSPRYTHMVSEEGRANLKRVGLDVETWLDEMIAFDNELINAFPEVTFAVHLCRGNHRSMWSVEGGYDAIAEQLFNGLAVDRILAEYDSPRAGTFAPLRFVPEGKVVVLGLITTKEPELEDADQLKGRIEEASKHIPLERLGLSPQCGFASTMPGNLVTFDDQRAKLELVAGVARDVWG
ncbi:MAG: cobalamin-independent methionine synthase II family protein [Actinomycetota bacterium]